MNFVNIFPAIIGYVEDKSTTDKILPIAKNNYLDVPDRITNSWGYKNTFNDMHNLTDPNLDFMREYITRMSYDYLKSINKKCPEVKIEIFFSEMGVNDSHDTHVHVNQILTGIFYLSVKENSAPLLFHDQRPHLDFINFPDINPEINTSKFIIPPKDGLILIWPAWMKHQVPLNTQPNRITSVYHVMIKQ